jgi:murein DD-endopeptidase MepM/ murein hydrolase activator NlpD
MRSEGVTRIGLWALVTLTVLAIHACAPRRVTIGRPSPSFKKGVYHVVERHQTLYRICKTYQVDMEKVASVNDIFDPSKIEVGQRIFIPGARRVLEVDVVIDDVVTESGEREQDKPERPRPDFSWPVKGRLSDFFEDAEEKRHQGVDIVSPLGTPIKAAGSGKVIYSGNTIRGYGNLVILRHPEDYVTVYAHNQVNLVEEGMWVERGQVIGKVGKTGRATGYHLHFEIRKNNRAVDPLPYLK